MPAKLVLDPESGFSYDDYVAFCLANPDLRLERTSKGEIVIVPPAGLESSNRSVDVAAQLHYWAKRDKRGKAADSSAEFILPNGAALSPDAAWISNEKLGRLSKDEKRKFPRLCPEFIAQVISPSDRLPAAREKMAEWLANGVELGWLIDGDTKTVYVFRPGRETEVLSGIDELAGDGPVKGFVLDLTDIWVGL